MNDHIRISVLIVSLCVASVIIFLVVLLPDYQVEVVASSQSIEASTKEAGPTKEKNTSQEQSLEPLLFSPKKRPNEENSSMKNRLENSVTTAKDSSEPVFELPKFRYIGRVIDDSGNEWWYVSPGNSGAVAKITIGMELDGWLLGSINNDNLMFSKGKQIYELKK